MGRIIHFQKEKFTLNVYSFAMLKVISQKIRRPKYILLVLVTDINTSAIQIRYDDKMPYYIREMPDGTFRGSLTGSYTSSKSFSTPEQAVRWLKNNMQNLEFQVHAYQVVSVEDMDTWMNNRPDGQFMQRDFPFQWQLMNGAGF
jgi:hypothetical protein